MKTTHWRGVKYLVCRYYTYISRQRIMKVMRHLQNPLVTVVIRLCKHSLRHDYQAITYDKYVMLSVFRNN